MGKEEDSITTAYNSTNTALGKVFLVGAGPGDPALLTLRGKECLQQADLVLYDALAHPELLAHCKPQAECAFVGKRAGRVAARQQAINARLVAEAQAGKYVVRLKGGDPYLFGRGSEEAECLAQAGIPFEVIPGVPSPVAATAYAGISLSHRDKASSIAYLTATESPDKAQSSHDFSKLATATQTLVIFMGLRKLRELTQQLIAHGRSADCPAAVIQAASLPEQRTVVGTLATLADLAEQAGMGMPALTVVGDVVGLRPLLRWYDRQPLFGKRVLVTRAKAQAQSFVTALRRVGASAVPHPTIRIEPVADPQPLADAVTAATDYDWVLFTSPNGVQQFFNSVQAMGRDARCLGQSRVGAIGPGTAESLTRFGIRADYVPDEYVGEAFAEGVLAHHDGHMHGMSVLLPRAEIARNALPDRLRQGGARVTVVDAYRTLPPTDDDIQALQHSLRTGAIDIATFTSPSTIQHTVQALGSDAQALLAAVTVASIGPITTAAAERLGIRVDVTAQEYTLPGLIAALEAHARALSPEASNE